MGISKKQAKGWDNARARDNQHLPLSWRHLSKGDLQEISAAIKEIEMRRGALDRDRVSELEAALAISAMLTTGRTFEQLHSLEVCRSSVSEILSLNADHLVQIDDHWGWWVTAGQPHKPKILDELAKAQAHNTAKRIYLPVADRVRRILDLLQIGQKFESLEPFRLFETDQAALTDKITEILKNRRGPERLSPRRVSCTVEALERWQTSEITHTAGGDLAAAVAVTSRDEPMARSVSYYGNFRSQTAWRAAADAVKAFSTFSSGYEKFPQLASLRTGGSYVPTDEQVGALAKRLWAAWAECGSDPVKRHKIITDYTVALLSFALGHRGLGDSLPGWRAINFRTQLCQIHEKNVTSENQARVVWVAPAAFRQLMAYEAYLDRLWDEVHRTKFAAFLNTGDSLPLFDLNCESGAAFGRNWRWPPSTLTPLTLSDVWRRIQQDYDWHLPPNAPRHWLRAKLTGRCSTETLNAFFGHWQQGTEAWGSKSCLNPVVWRADLRRSLPPVLSAVGFAPFDYSDFGEAFEPERIPNTQKKGKARSPYYGKGLGDLDRNTNDFHDIPRFRSAETDADLALGELLASAIQNGALLDKRQWTGWLRAVCSRAPQSAPYLDLNRNLTVDQGQEQLAFRRWFYDEKTKAILDRNRHLLPENPDKKPESYAEKFLRTFNVSVNDFLLAAEFHWRQRIPPLLVEHAMGNVETVSANDYHWSLFRGERVYAKHAPVQLISEPSNNFAKYGEICQSERRAFWGPWDDYLHGRCTLAAAKRECAQRAKELSKRNDRIKRSPGRTQLLEWCVSLLEEKRPRPARRGLAPMTVQAYFIAILFELYDKEAAAPNFIIEFDDFKMREKDKITEIAHPRRRATLKAAVRRFELFLNPPSKNDGDGVKRDKHRERRKAEGETEEEFGDGDDTYTAAPDAAPVQRVFLNLILPEEYDAAIAYCREKDGHNELGVMIMLGYRAGLRMGEIVGLKPDDFIVMPAKGILELHVQRHPGRELKTPQSRRIIPLDVLLEKDELLWLEEWHARRAQLARKSSPNSFCFGPLGAAMPLWAGEQEKGANDVLRRATKRRGGVVFHHLRHSFASYVLATLLLPENGAGLTPSSLSSVISHARRRRVAARLLGAERLGQSALHAVSQLMGHTGVDMTLHTYIHLLDLSLADHVCRDWPAGGLSKSDDGHAGWYYDEFGCLTFDREVVRLSDYRAPTNQNVPEAPARPTLGKKEKLPPLAGRLDWLVLHDLLTMDEREGLDAFAKSLQILPTKVRSWRTAGRQLAERVIDRKDAALLTKPQGVDAQNLVGKLWQNLPAELSDEQKHAIRAFITGYDRKRSLTRFRTKEDATQFCKFLTSLDLDEELIEYDKEQPISESGLKSKVGRPTSFVVRLNRSPEVWKKLGGHSTKSFDRLKYAVRFTIYILAIYDDIWPDHQKRGKVTRSRAKASLVRAA